MSGVQTLTVEKLASLQHAVQKIKRMQGIGGEPADAPIYELRTESVF